MWYSCEHKTSTRDPSINGSQPLLGSQPHNPSWGHSPRLKTTCLKHRVHILQSDILSGTWCWSNRHYQSVDLRPLAYVLPNHPTVSQAQLNDKPKKGYVRSVATGDIRSSDSEILLCQEIYLLLSYNKNKNLAPLKMHFDPPNLQTCLWAWVMRADGDLFMTLISINRMGCNNNSRLTWLHESSHARVHPGGVTTLSAEQALIAIRWNHVHDHNRIRSANDCNQ